MRSRYSAYALGLVDYIEKTQLSPINRGEIEAFCRGTDFRDLEILEEEGDSVTFRAVLFQGERDVSFIEKSLFRRERGSWIYIRRVTSG